MAINHKGLEEISAEEVVRIISKSQIESDDYGVRAITNNYLKEKQVKKLVLVYDRSKTGWYNLEIYVEK